MNSEHKMEVRSEKVIWDNSPYYAVVFLASAFFSGIALLLFLLKKWAVWIVK